MAFWLSLAILIPVYNVYCHRLHETELEQPRLLTLRKRALLHSRYDLEDVIEEEDEYVHELEDELLNLEYLINELTTEKDARHDSRMMEAKPFHHFHVLFARHPYTLQNQNLLNSFSNDIAAAFPKGQYQLQALRDHFMEALERDTDVPPIVYQQVSNGNYRLDVSPLRRAVLTGLMIEQSVYTKTGHNPLYGIVLDRGLQEYHPLACKNSAQPQCAVNRLKRSTLDLFKRLYEIFKNKLQIAKKTKDELRSKIATWLEYGYIDKTHKGQHQLSRDIIPEALQHFLDELTTTNVDISSMVDKSGVMKNKMSAKTSKQLLEEWAKHIGDAHDLGKKESEAVVVVGGHSESLKDLMQGGTGVVIESKAKEGYNAAMCGRAHKVCNCQLVYFQVDLSSGAPKITQFKSIWRPSDVSMEYINGKKWDDISDPKQLMTA